MRAIRPLIILSLVAESLIAGAPPLRGQTLGGTLIDRKTKLPIRSATITLVGALAKVVATTKSDSAGEFYLDAPKPGKYSVAFALDSLALGLLQPLELKAGQFVQGTIEFDTPGAEAYFEFQVSKIASPHMGNPAPRFPVDLRGKSIAGIVVLQFVVDTAGAADMSTVRTVKGSDERFSPAVLAVLPKFRFYSAEAETPNGPRKVRQFVQMPFTFNVSP